MRKHDTISTKKFAFLIVTLWIKLWEIEHYLWSLFALVLEYSWSVFSRIWTEYRDLQSKSPYTVQIWENTDQKNSAFGHFLLSVVLLVNSAGKFMINF